MFSSSLFPTLSLSGKSFYYNIKPGPPGQVKSKGYADFFINTKSRWRSHESGEKRGPLASDSPIQAISLFNFFFISLSFYFRL